MRNLGHKLKAGSEGRNLEERTNAETLEQFTHVLSHSPQDLLPRDSTSHKGLNPLTLINNYENVTQTCPQGIIPQRRFPISQAYQIHNRDSLRNSHLLADFGFAPSHFWNAPSMPPLEGTLSGNRDAEGKIALVWVWGGRMVEEKLEEDWVENHHLWPCEF